MFENEAKGEGQEDGQSDNQRQDDRLEQFGFDALLVDILQMMVPPMRSIEAPTWSSQFGEQGKPEPMALHLDHLVAVDVFVELSAPSSTSSTSI